MWQAKKLGWFQQDWREGVTQSKHGLVLSPSKRWSMSGPQGQQCRSGAGWCHQLHARGLFSSSLAMEPSKLHQIEGHWNPLKLFLNAWISQCCDPHLFSCRSSSVRRQGSVRYKRCIRRVNDGKAAPVEAQVQMNTDNIRAARPFLQQKSQN